MKFQDLGLDDDLIQATRRSGFDEATPIQAQTIPLALAGVDVIGQAQTGTGKTAAFGLPVLQKVDMTKRAVQALIISPTRELAIQTQEEIFKLGKEKKTHVQVVFGGSDIRRQMRSLKKAPQVLVGTPGRLLDLINRKALDLSHVATLILDEADEMLDMGFLQDIEAIIKNVPKQRQTLLFSATMPPAILKVGEQFMHEPTIVKIKAKELTTDLVDQYYVRAKEREKFDIMTKILAVQHPKLAIVFGRTKRRIDELAKGLVARGFNAAGIHGDLTQQRRMDILRRFKDQTLDILVATDVAARGLDISGVTHVYNYDIPQDPESYVHRIGRTGRAGHNGVSVTFVTPNELGYLRTIEQLTKKRMSPLRPPTQKEAFVAATTHAMGQIETLVGQADSTTYQAQINALLEKYRPEDLVAVLLGELTHANQQDVPVEITPERPLPRRRNRGGKKHFSKKRDEWRKKKFADAKPKKASRKSHKQTTNRKFTIRTKER